MEGEPTPEVTWLINGKEVAPSDDAVMAMENGKAMLTLKGVTPDKAGEVTCKVRDAQLRKSDQHSPFFWQLEFTICLLLVCIKSKPVIEFAGCKQGRQR